MANRDLALETPHGDRLVFGLCRSKPAVQRYLTALVADLDTRTRFSRIELKQSDYFCGTRFGWHHQKIRVALGGSRRVPVRALLLRGVSGERG